MKDYREMAERVLARRDEYLKKKKKTTQRGLLSAGICSILAIFCIGVFYDAPTQETGGSAINDTAQFTMEPQNENPTYREANKAAGMLTADSQQMADVFIPAFVAYNGCLYVVADETDVQWDLTHPGGLQLREDYFRDVYATQADPELIAVKTAGGYTAFKKLFDLKFSLNGTTYGICCTANTGEDFSIGEPVLDCGDYLVCTAIDAEKNLEDTYIVNIGTLLQREFPNLFDTMENHSEFYWLAKPLPIEHSANSGGVYVEVPNVSAMGTYASAYGGCYLDGSEFHIVLVEDSPEIRREICKIMGVKETETIFVPGQYSLSYLTELQEKISNGMMKRTLPFVISSGVYENENRIKVSVLPETSNGELRKLYALDALGGAITVVEREIMEYN